MLCVALHRCGSDLDAGTDADGDAGDVGADAGVTCGAFLVDLGRCSAVLTDAGPSCEQTFEDFIFCSDIACGACTTETALDECISYAQYDPQSACVLNYPMADTCWNALNAVSNDAFQAACGLYPGGPGQ